MFVRSALFAVAATVASVVTTGFAVAPAYAGEVAKAHVQYRDLNLASPEGRTAVERRIRYAARGVCDTPTGFDLQRTIRAETCRTRAIVAANGQLEMVLARIEARSRLAGADATGEVRGLR